MSCCSADSSSSGELLPCGDTGGVLAYPSLFTILPLFGFASFRIVVNVMVSPQDISLPLSG